MEEKKMNDKQLYAAQINMIEWLSDPHELGKAPKKIECVGQFDYCEMHYYMFKFKSGLFGKWLLGVSGGFEGEDLQPCGHTFSNMQPYNENTTQNDCLKIIEYIMNYWKEQAKKFEE
jgi:hypothetical protein